MCRSKKKNEGLTEMHTHTKCDVKSTFANKIVMKYDNQRPKNVLISNRISPKSCTDERPSLNGLYNNLIRVENPNFQKEEILHLLKIIHLAV